MTINNKLDPRLQELYVIQNNIKNWSGDKEKYAKIIILFDNIYVICRSGGKIMLTIPFNII